MPRVSIGRNTILLGAAGVVLVGCAQVDHRADQPAHVAIGAPAPVCDLARDRAAILSMAGEHDVRFSFEETVALVPGYERKTPYHAAASELVLVVESSERKVVLQHLLAADDEGKRRAIKHWRQDWTFEDETVLEYRGGQRWVKRPLSPGEARCGWTQAVFEINDAPRYEGWGRFVHTGGTSTWTSNATWRPLPRREREREDYDVIVGVNRHTMTALGWVHEQDNTKVALRGEPRELAREHGVNLYTRSPSQELGLARDFWRQHEGFWQDVRAAWARVIDARTSVSLRKGEASSLYKDLVAIETSARPGDRVERAGEVLAKHLEAHSAER